jgi:hypothetical protein
MNVAKVGAALLQMDAAGIARLLKTRWMSRTFPHGMHYRDEAARFDRLYLVRDPWSMNCEREEFRFKETNRVVTENFDRPHDLLEIGCGEGLQSNGLRLVCDHLYGIDVSTRAVRRAKRRCPKATFAVASMYGLPQSIPLTRFDLVTACEVLYYVADVPRALERLSELGHGCLVSYYDGMREGLHAHVAEVPGVQFELISYEGFSWTFAWWRA